MFRSDNRVRLATALLLLGASGGFPARAAPAQPRPATYANPIDLNYRFALADHKPAKGWSAREAADPTIVRHGGDYWLFVSKSGGYWRSTDLLHWAFQPATAGFPTEEYAPTVAVLDGTWLLATSGGKAVYATANPAGGAWRQLGRIPKFLDPDIFRDDDGRVYLFAGSSPDAPITGVELDPAHGYTAGREPTALIPGLDPVHHGWEAYAPFDSDAALRSTRTPPWMEAPWMTKHGGIYYLQYAAPGTELATYADGVYTASSPLGPYRYEPYSPVSSKPSGFVTSAGHSSVTDGPADTMWRVTTMRISVHFNFERRLGLFPTGFVKAGDGPDRLVTNTYLGDYPQFAPGVASDPLRDNLAGWMLLTLKKSATASSTLAPEFGVEKAFDEDIRTWWSAATGAPGEWLQVDMGKRVRIDAVQINFADQGSTAHGIVDDAYRYRIEVSDDGRAWRTLIDRSDSRRAAPHEYVQLDHADFGRFARITNVHMPAGAAFSVSGFRIFGSALGAPPAQVAMPQVRRDPERRVANVGWEKAAGADFYVVRYGIRPDLLNQNYQVYDGTAVRLAGLNSAPAYYFTVDAVNASGITRGSRIAELP